LVNKAVQK